jgi:N-acylneuraminate cytidylyltransferase
MNVGFLPARGGSKRIKGKNSREFLGKPLFTYALDVAFQSGVFNKIIVSSDSEEILSLARKFGAEAVERDSYLANDEAGISEVVKHFLIADDTLEESSGVCCILPTNPFIKSSILKSGVKHMESWDYVFPIMKFNKPIERALERERSGLTRMSVPTFANIRTQDTNEFYFDAGQFYWAKKSTWLDKSNILAAKNFGIILEPFSSVDIDDEFDWKLAELIYSSNLK